MKYLEVPVIRAVQGKYTFYVGLCQAKALVKIAYVRERAKGEGVQRILSAKRLREIGDYVRKTDPPGLLPNAIILRVSPDAAYDKPSGMLRIPDRPDEAFVVDGQHRLFAFRDKYVGEFDMPLPFAAFVGLDLPEVAYLFQTINSTQRKINPSLVYDLLPYLREREWAKFEDDRAQYLVQALAEDPESSWYRRVAMLGGREAPITQASFVTAVKVQLKRGRVLSSTFLGGAFAGQEIQYELLRRYFSAIADVFHSEWLNAEYVVSKNLAVNAFLNILGAVVTDISSDSERHFSEDELTLQPERFRPYLTKLKRTFSWRRTEMARTYLGAAGIRRLTDEMLAVLGLETG